MRASSLIGLVIVSLACLAGPASAVEYTIALSDVANAQPGDTIHVYASVNADVGNIGSFDIMANFDPVLLTPIDVDAG